MGQGKKPGLTVLTVAFLAMTDPDSSYRPRSPDFSSFQSAFSPPATNTYQPQPAYLASPLGQRASYDASPFFNAPYQPPVANSRPPPQQYAPQPFPYDADYDMSRRSARLSAATQQPAQQAFYDQPVSFPPPTQLAEPVQRKPWDGIEVKTKFPVARIKRIMQADEDVGKVAQVTPIAVCTRISLRGGPHVGMLTQMCSESARALHDFPRHQSGARSEGS